MHRMIGKQLRLPPLIGAAIVLALGVLSGRPATPSGTAMAAVAAQATATVQSTGRSEIGSTDGIVLLGILTVMIVVIPVVWYRVIWSRE